MKTIKTILRILIVIFVLLLVFSLYKLLQYRNESKKSEDLFKSYEEYVVQVTPQEGSEVQPSSDETPEGETPVPTVTAAPLKVDFTAMRERNSDVATWIYCDATRLNYPVMQSEDNSYYLRRMPDGTSNMAGSLFLDCRSSGDLSDLNSVIYGHNMKNGTMFSTLEKYKTQGYYEQHPVMYIILPEAKYRIELIAGCIVNSGDAIYVLPPSEENITGVVNSIVQRSTFRSNVSAEEGDRFITLSTCSYEYDEARYVLIGRLVAVD